MISRKKMGDERFAAGEIIEWNRGKLAILPGAAAGF